MTHTDIFAAIGQKQQNTSPSGRIFVKSKVPPAIRRALMPLVRISLKKPPNG